MNGMIKSSHFFLCKILVKVLNLLHIILVMYIRLWYNIYTLIKGVVVMKVKEFPVKDMDVCVTVIEVDRQKDILCVLDELIENDEYFRNDERYVNYNVFMDEAFFILYKDGSYYSNVDGDVEGIYKKKNIKGIHYSNPEDSQVYGEYEVNEWGCVTLV